MGKHLLAIILLSVFLFPVTLTAQIVVASNSNANQLAQTLAGTGVTISNVQLNCPGTATGTFTCSNCNVGMGSGIVLTSGDATLVAGPNNSSGITGLGTGGAGDADLDNVSSAATYDACILEFDMQVLSDSVEFRYVFGSEEYLEYVNGGYNDVFAFFISGPGIAGQQNIALVPGTATPVTIDNVNDVNYSQYYVDNGDGFFTSPNNTDPYYIQYDGFTTVLTAKKKGLQPCSTYHLKLAIADAGDNVLDSGVFLEANSLTSNAVQVDDATTNGSGGGGGVSNAMEGCIDGSVRFFIETPIPQPYVIHYGIGGTATNGVDYTFIADSIILPANDSDVYLTIHPISDGLVEGTENLILYLYNSCNSIPYDSSVLLIVDSFGLAVSGDTSICAGQSAQIYAGGSFNYVWQPAASLDNNLIPSPTATPATSTTYVVTTNIAGCISSDSVRVTVIPPPFSVTAADVNNCGNPTAQLNATVTGTPVNGNPFQYSWTLPATLNNATIQNPVSSATTDTTYIVTVSSGGCADSDTMRLTVGAAVIVMSGTDESCFGFADGTATATVQNPSGTYTYAWSNGGTASTISGLTSGTYRVTVTQNANCSTVDSVTISAPPLMTLTQPAITDVTCFGGSNGSITITASGGAGGYVYVWNTGTTGSTIGNLPANTYSLVVTDADNCTVTATATVSQPTQLVANATNTNVSCFGGNNGTALASSTGGTGSATYLWSNGANTASITGLAVGNYTVTATDGNSCTASSSVTVTEPQLLTLSATPANVSCFSGSNGTVTTATTGGTGNKGYLWNTGATAVNLTGTTAGSYTVTVTDANSCTASASATVTEPTQLTMQEVVTNVTCYGGTNGSVNITVGGGSGGYNYLWNTTAQFEDLTGVGSGQYAVTATDANNCSITGTFIINQPTQITLGQPVIANVNCFGGNDGAVQVTPTGGTGSYTYTWNTVSGPNPKTGLMQGTYNVVVTDSFNCTAATTVNVTEPTLFTTSAIPQPATCFDGYNGGVASYPVGGTPPYEFLWSDPMGQTTQNAIALHSGTYSVLSTDANGCTATATALVTAPTDMTFNLFETAVLCPGDENGKIRVVAQGGNPPYNYSATQDGSNFVTSTDSLIIGLAVGYYSVIVSDNNGCTKVDTAFVPDAQADVFVVDSVSTSCYGSQYQDGSLHIEGTTIANMAYQYSVDGSPLQYSPDFYFLGAGPHQVTTVNGFGCTTNFTAIVPEPVDATVDVLPADSTVQLGDIIQLFSTFGPYADSAVVSYQWSPAEGLSCMDCPNPQVNTYARQNSYTLTVVYNNNCVATATALISVEGEPEVFIPNSFTPNGDGNNDLFQVYGNHIAQLEMDVFNRWGEKVCSFTSQYDSWDGTYKTQLQEPGVYVYNVAITYLNGKKLNRTGSITLVR